MGIFFEAFFSFFTTWLKDQVVELCTFIIDTINKYIIGFFDNEYILQFLKFSTWLNVFIFVVALFVVLIDIVEEKTSGNPIAITDIFMNVFKAFAFAYFARWLAQGSMELIDKVLKALQFDSIHFDTFDNATKSILASLGSSKILTVVFPIILLCACIVFFINSIKRFGTMFVHILTAFLYIPDIMRGNTVKMGEWLRQMLAISLTYAFTYLLFFLGCTFYIQLEYVLAIGMWLAMALVPKALNHFGWSSGSKGSFGGVVQGAMLAASSFR